MRAKQYPRRPPRLLTSDDSPLWFVTFCSFRRRPWLATPQVHAAFTRFAEIAHRDFNVAVGRYVIMPDHVHLFVRGGPEFALSRWVTSLKQVLGKAAPPEARGARPWQESFFDHKLRNDESMGEKWEYIRQNPVRAGLVSDPAAWPYQGEIVLIDRA